MQRPQFFVAELLGRLLKGAGSKLHTLDVRSLSNDLPSARAVCYTATPGQRVLTVHALLHYLTQLAPSPLRSLHLSPDQRIDFEQLKELKAACPQLSVVEGTMRVLLMEDTTLLSALSKLSLLPSNGNIALCIKSNNPIPYRQMQTFAHALSQFPTIKCLQFGWSALDEGGVNALVNGLMEGNVGLRSLTLKDNVLGPNAAFTVKLLEPTSRRRL